MHNRYRNHGVSRGKKAETKRKIQQIQRYGLVLPTDAMKMS
jgi:hypothetical protein